jgi:hypothetical protein
MQGDVREVISGQWEDKSKSESESESEKWCRGALFGSGVCRGYSRSEVSICRLVGDGDIGR